MHKVLAIIGNTGVGKSKLAIELAKKFNGEIINADSLQMYEGADIITNKHPLEERDEIPHHLLGHIGWDEQYTVKHFEKEAKPLIDRLSHSKKLPILVGGTHYYIQSLISESLIGELGDGNSLSELQLKILDDPKSVEQELSIIDPVITAKFHPNDTRRLRRALEVHYTTGKLPSEIYASQEAALKYDTLVIWVHCDKEVLTNRLYERVDVMLNQGLMEEVKEMYDYHIENKTNINSSVWQAIGFRQFLPYLISGDKLSECIDAMKLQTCQYAKKQTKWINNKFVPFLDQIGARFATVDSTNINSWTQDVQARAEQITREWLDNTQISSLLLDTVEVGRKSGTFDKGQWVRHRCEACSHTKGREIIIVGNEAWEVHVNSKQHRALQRKWHSRDKSLHGVENEKKSKKV